MLRIEDTDAARARSASSSGCWPTCDGSVSTGTRVRTWAARTDRTGRASGGASTRRRSRRWCTGRVYPCFCTPEELQLARRAQLAAGRPPRYAGPAPRSRSPRSSADRGRRTRALRFRVPAGRVVEFDDRIHGPQRFASDDIGDFVVAAPTAARRSSSATPSTTRRWRSPSCCVATITWPTRRGSSCCSRRSSLPRPRYGHLPLLLGAVRRAPLSKRDGAAGLRDLREQGYLPGALRNYLLRLGHAVRPDDWLDPAEMPRHFDLGRTSRSAAHYDEAQLRHWQREAVRHVERRTLYGWLGSRLEPLGDARARVDSSARCVATCSFPRMPRRWSRGLRASSSRRRRRGGRGRCRTGVLCAGRRQWARTRATSRLDPRHRGGDGTQWRRPLHAAAGGADRQDARARARAAASR